jgi:competence protein ComEA
MNQPGIPLYRFVVWLIAALSAAILAFMVARTLDAQKAPPIIISDPSAEATIVIVVNGAVATPGAYELRAGSRVRDAIDLAGGPLPQADLREVNLARRLVDEERLVIPDTVATSVPDLNIRAPTETNDIAGKLDINRASAAELESLPGIGPVIAERIIAYRQEHGPFATIEDLDDVQGISRRMVEDLRPFISVGS